MRGGAAAGLLLVAVAVQTNLVPLPGWAPGIAVADTWSTFARTPMRGNLAGDTAWLADFRRHIQGIGDPAGLWKVADRSQIRIVYAADVPGTTTVRPDQAASVASYAADGTVIASTPVPGFENNTSGIPGDTPLTRVVP